MTAAAPRPASTPSSVRRRLDLDAGRLRHVHLADRGRLNPVTPAGGSATARYVRFTILGNQTPDFATSCPGGAFSGCQYTDLTEIEVYGRPAA